MLILIEQLICGLRGRHDYVASRSKRGYQTCRRCRYRKKL
jgi:hypothetical protein